MLMPEAKLIQKKDIEKALYDKYPLIMAEFLKYELEWLNSSYAKFHDIEKYLILIYYMKQTLEESNKTFLIRDFDDYYKQKKRIIYKVPIVNISKGLNISKETVRRKVGELIKGGVIVKKKNATVVNYEAFASTKPVNSIINLSKFFGSFIYNLNGNKISHKIIESKIKKYYSLLWVHHFEFQFKYLKNVRKIIDLESVFIFGLCVLNTLYLSKKEIISKSLIVNRDEYLENFKKYTPKQGLNSTSIADISGIPRATVIRKLKLLDKKNLLIRNKLNLYEPASFTTPFFKEIIIEKNLIYLTEFIFKSLNILKL